MNVCNLLETYFLHILSFYWIITLNLQNFVGITQLDWSYSPCHIVFKVSSHKIGPLKSLIYLLGHNPTVLHHYILDGELTWDSVIQNLKTSDDISQITIATFFLTPSLCDYYKTSHIYTNREQPASYGFFIMSLIYLLGLNPTVLHHYILIYVFYCPSLTF